MDATRLQEIVGAHAKWVNGRNDGKRADLSGVALSGADLTGADLTGADLTGADLSGVALSGADLTGADLSDADLARADLSGADLAQADLTSADLTEADLSGATHLLSPLTWLQENFQTDADGLVVYKAVGNTDFVAPVAWTIEAGHFLQEVCNPCRTTICGCGVSFGTREWCTKAYPNSDLWQCRIRWHDLAGVVVPYNTDGKARCERLELVERLSTPLDE